PRLFLLQAGDAIRDFHVTGVQTCALPISFQHVKTSAGQTMVDLFSKMDPDKEWTPRDLAEFIGIGGTGPTIVGSPATVADELISWMDETGIDGYNIGHAVKYQDIADFVELVVTELRRRGVVRG